MEEFLKYLISPLLVNPDQLSININDSTVTLEVGPDDTGRIIGKHGSVIHSLRILLKTFCSVHDLPQVTLVLNSPPLKTD